MSARVPDPEQRARGGQRRAPGDEGGALEPPRVGVSLAVLAALLVLTASTVALAYVDLGAVGHVLVALAIAGAKAGLVMAFFMHLGHEGRLQRLFAGAGVSWLAFLVLLVIIDTATR